MFNNTTCEIFKQNIDNVISNSQLPPVVAYYILKDSLKDLQNLCRQALEYQRQKALKQKEESEKEQEEEAE